MMMGVLWNEEIRESLFWPGLVRGGGAGVGVISGPHPAVARPPPARPVWPPSAHRPGPVSPAAGLRLRASVESVACLRLRVSLVHVVQQRTHSHHISITGHEYRHYQLSISLQPSHITTSPDPQWWTVCYEQVKAEHISQSPCAWVPGNQGSDHTRTKTKVAITFTSSPHKHQTRSECWCPAPWPLPCPPWCPPGCPAPPPPPPSCPPSPPPYRSVARDNSTSQQQPGRLGCAASVLLWALSSPPQLSASGPALVRGGGHMSQPTHHTGSSAQSCTGFLISGKCFK